MMGEWLFHIGFPLANKQESLERDLVSKNYYLLGHLFSLPTVKVWWGYLACPSWNFFCQHFFAGSIFLLFPAPGVALLPVAHHLDHSPFHFLRSPVEAPGEQVTPLGEFEPAGGRLVQAWFRWAQAPQFADAWGRRRVEWKE